MMRRNWLLPTLLAMVAFVVEPAPARSEQWHQFDIINNTPTGLWITYTLARCVTEVDYDSTIAAGSRTTFRWNDTDDSGCGERDKFVGFQFHLINRQCQWPNWLAITHRRLSGSNWYNGQFYAATLAIGGDGSITYGDGEPPPGWIQAQCSHNNDCFGPVSEMEIDDKNSYNWQRSYQTEDGWAFQINDPGC